MRLRCLSACLAYTLGGPAGVWADPNTVGFPSSPSAGLAAGVRVEFATTNGRAALQFLGHASGPNWAGPFPEKGSLWRLAMRGPGSATAELASGDLSLTGVDAHEAGAALTWRAPLGQGQVVVSLTVTPAEGPELSAWRLVAHLPDGWKVARADWPTLPNLRAEGGLKMAAPYGWGREYDVKPGLSYAGTYPSMVASMPFVAFYRDGKGLYFGAHDEQGHHKHLAVTAREDGIGVTCTHWPADADTTGGRYAPSFQVVVGAFAGDYWEAGRIYRAFTRRTRWGDPDGQRLSDPNRLVPAWLRDIDLWLIPGAEPLANVEACRKAGAFFGVPIAMHWYSWHEIPFDTLYPEYFPPKPGFREGVEALQAAGFRVMPYINGRLCDPKSKTWTQEGGDKNAARQDNGEPYTEVYGSKVPLNVMCPATPMWRDKIAGIVDRLVSEYGVDGVYIDQIGAAGAVRCFSPNHGHSPGGGTLWIDGYRGMLDQIRAKLPRDRVLTTEENAECWNDQFDALLMVNTSADGARRIVPLMPTVYGGRMITFGSQYIAAEDMTESLPFREKMARAFLYGAQLGWVSVGAIMADGAAKEAEFLRNLARCRQDGHAFLLTGEFLGEVEVAGDNPPLASEGAAGAKRTTGLPAVRATAWRAQDRTVGLAVVNLSDAPHAVEVGLPWKRLQSVDGELASPPGSNTPKNLSVTMPPREARILRAGPATRPAR